MEKFDIYADIARRTNGDIYVGVVGPVRTGKSTFITRFMESMVLPHIADPHLLERTRDELPQSADGKTIMTTQPKFVPNEAVTLQLDQVTLNVRMLDCVGYLVEGAMGHMEDEAPRLVRTPWSEQELPFEKAAEIGTRRVIRAHSTIGILLTSDGSICEIPRQNYVEAEERVVAELKECGKPFVIVLNTRTPDSEDTRRLGAALEEKYKIPVVVCNVQEISQEQIAGILEKILFQFPIRRLDISLPEWMKALPADHEIISGLIEEVRVNSSVLCKMEDHKVFLKLFNENEYFELPQISSILPGEGRMVCRFEAKAGLFNAILSGIAGEPIEDDFALMMFVQKLAKAKFEYDKLKEALNSVKECGYGVVTPGLDEMSLETPEIVRHGSRFGVRLKASAPSLHIMRVDINTEVSPIVGTEQQSEELVKYLLSEFEHDPKGIWETNMFGKSLHMLVKENLANKLHAMPQDAQKKMRRTLGRIVNEGKGGMICILL